MGCGSRVFGLGELMKGGWVDGFKRVLGGVIVVFMGIFFSFVFK